MSVFHEPTVNYPQIFLSDRNIMMIGGGTHTWNASNEWAFTEPIYMNWFAGRLRGTATYNKIEVTNSPITIGNDEVVYVDINPNAEGASLTPVVIAGTALTKADNRFVIAMVRNLYGSNNPLELRNGVIIPVGGSWSATGGGNITGYADNFSGTTWNVTHSLNTYDVSVTLYDTTVSPRKQVWPENIFIVDANNIQVTFSATVAGRCVVIKGNTGT